MTLLYLSKFYTNLDSIILNYLECSLSSCPNYKKIDLEENKILDFEKN